MENCSCWLVGRFSTSLIIKRSEIVLVTTSQIESLQLENKIQIQSLYCITIHKGLKHFES